ncbi:hypothetical protein B566_EDAN000638 [Ephemera danica]|nr:hypothetical protein B566_EDAN000638 [Ephemera danica]
MGTIFSFVGSDVKTKIEILEEIRTKDTSGNMKTIKQLILYELQEDLLKKKDYVSGSRTLLRLHRGLGALNVVDLVPLLFLILDIFTDFISLFLQRVSEVDHKDGTANVCQEAYNLTLAQHHTWIIRKTAVVAMYALPTKEGLLHKVC